MATAPANAIEEFDEIEEFPDAPVIEEFDEPVDIGREAQRATAAALQGLDAITTGPNLDWSEAAADEVNTLRQQAAAAYESRNANEGIRLGSAAQQLETQLQTEAPQSTGAQRLRQQFAGPQQNIEGFQQGNFLGRGLSQIAQGVGLTPLAHNIEQAGMSPIGMNFQANIGAAAGGVAGAGLMTVPGGQGLGATLLAPMAGGLFGGLAGGAGQEVIERSQETPEQTEARHEALAETQREAPLASMVGGSMANAPFLRPSLSMFLQAMAGNRTAQATLGASAAIGGAMGALPSIARDEPISLTGIAQAAMENTIFNKPTRLGRVLGLPAVDAAQPVQEDTGFQPVTIDPATAQSGLTTRPTTSTVDVFASVRRPGEESPNVTPEPEQTTPVQEPPQVVEEAAPAPETTAPVVEDAGRAVPPAPVAAADGQPTGIRNAVVDAARAEAGIPPRELPLARSFPQIHEEARAALANDPEAGRRLVTELGENIRPLTDTEDAVLTFEQNAREQERTAAMDAVNNAADPEAREAAIARLAEADNRLFEVYQVGQQAGTENARGLNARRLMQTQEFTLSKMLNEKRAFENNGEPLSREQTVEVEALHKQISELESKLASAEAQTAKSNAQAEYRRILRETKREAGEAAKSKRSVTDFMDDAAEKARQRIIARRGKLQVTVDPLNIAGLVDEAIIGASYVAKGVRNVAEWSKQMINEFGERIRPHLDALFAKATALADDTGKSFTANAPKTPEQILGSIKDGAKLEKRVVYDLARAHVNSGMDDFNQVMTRVTEDLKPRFPNLTERQVMDALSGYGKISTPSKQEDLRKLREFRNLARLTSQLEDAQKGIPPKKTGAQRDKASAKVRDLQKKVNDAMRAAGIERTGPDQIASGLQASKTRIRNTIEDLQNRIKRNDYEERTKREPALDREKIDLQFELAKVKEKWNQGLIEAKRAKRPLGEKIWDASVETINLGRQLLTSADLPPVFRQGLFGIGRPIQATKAAVDATKAMFSEKERFRIMQEIDERPNAPLYSRSKLYLARDTAQPLNQMEENFMGNWFKQLPRWTIVGPLLRASERGYNTFLNRMRADSFDSLVKAFNISETDTATLNSLAANINTFTGRSTLPLKKLEQAAPGLNTFLFAPRFMMSRFKVATGQPLWTGTRKSKLAALDTYARTLGGLATIYGLANLAGGDVETDPRSSDFGKIKFGQTRLDPLGGLSQVTTFLTRVTTGETKTGKGRTVPLREDYRPLKALDSLFQTKTAAKGKPEMLVGDSTKVIGNFLRSKLNPIVGTAVNLASGKNIVGEKVTLGDAVVDSTVPISWQEILTTMEAQGVPKGTALFILSLFGMGLNTYEERKK